MKLCPSCRSGVGSGSHCCPECGIDLREVRDRAGTDLGGLILDGKYELQEFVGEGAMGWVYRGIHRALESSIAVKLMKPSADGDDTRDQRFEQEARSASHLNHPHIISVIDFGQTSSGLLYIVTEFLRGQTLAALLHQSGRLPIQRAALVMDQVLSALEEAHGAGLVHRDIKPENIFITPLRSGEDFVKVLDFGIAKLGGPADRRLTVQGQLFGTPAYMAPEQIRGQAVTPATDLYACGLILWELLVGREPFRSESIMEVLSAQLHQMPPPLRAAAPDLDLPEALEATVTKALAKDPHERFQTAADLRRAFHDALSRQRRSTAACPSCGAELTCGVRFCAQCGARCGDGPAPRTPQPSAAVLRPVAATSAGRLARPSSSAIATERERRITGTAKTEMNATPPRSTLNRRLSSERTVQFRFLGQERVVDDLVAFLEGERRVAFLEGPAGSGRTRLLAVARELSRERGLRPIHVTADPLLARRPWYPITRLVAEILDLPGRFDWELDGIPALEPDRILEAALDAGLSPEDGAGIRDLLGLPPAQGPVEIAVRKREVRSAVLGTLLRSRATTEGLVLLIDDLEEYDSASRALVAELIALGPTLPLRLIAVTEAALPQDATAVSIRPCPLSEPDIEDLLSTTLPRRTFSWPAMIATLSDRSGGSPLHLTQAMHLLAEGGSEIEAPLNDLIVTRIGRLPTEALRLLQVLCTLGLRVPTELAFRILDVPDNGPGALRLLARRGFVVQESETMVRIAHPRFVDCVREAMPAEKRRELHAQVYQRLFRAGAPSILLARHADEARLGEDTLAVLVSAGEWAEGRLDDADAALYYRRALQVARWELLRDEADPQLLELALRVATTLRFSGNPIAAEMILKEALAAAADQPALRARLLRCLAWLHHGRGERSEAVVQMRTALRFAIFAGDRDLLTDSYTDLGRLLCAQGATHLATEELDEGILMVTSGDGPTTRDAPAGFWRLVLQLAETQLDEGAVEASLKNATAALDQALRSHDRLGEARCHFHLARCLGALRSRAEADRHTASAFESFRLLGDRRSAAECLLEQAGYGAGKDLQRLSQAMAFAQQVNWPEGIARASRLSEMS
jgi:serine/threonine-protein kinase